MRKGVIDVPCFLHQMSQASGNPHRAWLFSDHSQCAIHYGVGMIVVIQLPGLVPTDVSDDSDDCRSNTGVLYFTATPRLPHEANAQVS